MKAHYPAKLLMKKLDDYKPLAKIEELEEENYNQIDNQLSNIPPDPEGRKDRDRISVKGKLEEKKAEIDAQDKNKPDIGKARGHLL